MLGLFVAKSVSRPPKTLSMVAGFNKLSMEAGVTIQTTMQGTEQQNMAHMHAGNDPADPLGPGTEGSAKARFLRPIYLLAAVPVLAIGLVASYLPKGTSQAATTPVHGVTWHPGEIEFVTQDGGCFTRQQAKVSASDQKMADTLAAVLSGLKTKDDVVGRPNSDR